MVLVICLFVLSILAINGCVKEEPKTNNSFVNVSIDDPFVKSILKPEYLNGSGKIEKEERMGLTLYNATITTWISNGTTFIFTDDPLHGTGNFNKWNKELRISSTENKFFDLETFPFLDCNSFNYSNYTNDYPASPLYSISVKKTNETVISVGSHRPRAFHIPGIGEVLDYVSTLPANCTF